MQINWSDVYIKIATHTNTHYSSHINLTHIKRQRDYAGIEPLQIRHQFNKIRSLRRFLRQPLKSDQLLANPTAIETSVYLRPSSSIHTQLFKRWHSHSVSLYIWTIYSIYTQIDTSQETRYKQTGLLINKCFVNNDWTYLDKSDGNLYFTI